MWWYIGVEGDKDMSVWCGVVVVIVGGGGDNVGGDDGDDDCDGNDVAGDN